MATPYLGLVTLTVGQTGKETTANNMTTRLEQATQRTFSVDMSGGNVALTETQWVSNYVFECDGQTADRTLTVPDEVASNGANTSQRVFAVHNIDTVFNAIVQQDALGDTVTVLPGEAVMLRADGTNVFRIDNAFDFGGYVAGAPTGSANMYRFIADRPFRLLTGLPGAVSNVRVAFAAAKNYDLQKNGVSIGTMSFAMAATTATFTFASDVDFVSGDVFGIIAPVAPDAAALDHSWTFPGKKM